ncbi:MAG TPA: glucose-1-phosphate adenylyltransferase subunit GlgD, partial [Bacilli bacterium]
MVNSGIKDVAVLTYHKYRSLMDHLGSGDEWDLDRKRGGLFILPSVLDEPKEHARGDLFQLYCQRDYLYRGKQEYVMISRSHMVCNIDLNEVMDFHMQTEADITMVYKEMDQPTDSKFRRVAIREDGSVSVIEDQLGSLRGNKVSMEIYLIKKDLLLDMVETSLGQGYDHFVRDAIMKNIHNLKIFGYQYKGYLGIINTVQSYYNHSMNLLNADVWKDLFYSKGLIYTKIKDEPPARYAAHAEVHNSLIANGCIIEGKVENCILFRGVRIDKGVHVKNSIIMQNCIVQENSSLENAILDKDVIVNKDRSVKGEKLAPFIIAKNRTI